MFFWSSVCPGRANYQPPLTVLSLRFRFYLIGPLRLHTLSPSKPVVSDVLLLEMSRPGLSGIPRSIYGRLVYHASYASLYKIFSLRLPSRFPSFRCLAGSDLNFWVISFFFSLWKILQAVVWCRHVAFGSRCSFGESRTRTSTMWVGLGIETYYL